MNVNIFFKNIMAIKNAFFYSVNGIKFLLKERAFKQEILCGVILSLIELFRNTSYCMLLYMFSSFILILLAESLNSAIETAIDRISFEKNELSKKAKDIGSALVFLSFINLLIVLICVLFAHVESFTFH